MKDIIKKYVEEIKSINSCGADMIMDSVLENLLMRFSVELYRHIKDTEEKFLKK